MKTTTAANGGDIQNSLEKGADKAVGAAHGAIDSAADATRPAIDDLVARSHKAVDRAGVVAGNAAGALGVRGDQLNDNGKRIVARAGSYVRENPVTSLGIAVAAGYMLSRMFSSR